MSKAFLSFLIVSSLVFNSCSSVSDADNTELNNYLIEASSSFNEGEYNKAEELFSKVLIIDSSNEIALNNQIITLNKLNKNSEALALSNKAIRFYPSNLKFKIEKARLLKIENQNTEAIMLYQKILSVATHESSYHREYLNFLLAIDYKNNNQIKNYIVKESIYLLENNFNDKEALIALCTVDKTNLKYSLLLKSKYASEWDKIYNVNNKGSI
ncbi:MAG: hypothetical protein JJE21_05690 [Spirochaetaceae bacterium]|nr:hypothetical protein [Spirochaetaceae bacterium]